MDVDTRKPRRARGLTLVELVTTLAVAGISLAVLVPSWNGMAERSRVTTTANLVLTHLRYARSEAVHRNTMVSVCPSNDGDTCSGDPHGWHNGYLVFVDSDGNRSRSPDEALLRVEGAKAPGVRLHTTTGRPAIRFRPDGGAWGTNATFSVCAGEDESAYRAVILYGTGRARVDRRTPGNRPVSCT